MDLTDLPPRIRQMLYEKPGIGPCARRRLRRRLGIGRQNRHGNSRRKIRWLREIACDRQGWKCYYCAIVMVAPDGGPDQPNMATAEHLLPRAAGGADVECNIVGACLECNNEKADKDVRDFKEGRRP